MTEKADLLVTADEAAKGKIKARHSRRCATLHRPSRRGDHALSSIPSGDQLSGWAGAAARAARFFDGVPQAGRVRQVLAWNGRLLVIGGIAMAVLFTALPLAAGGDASVDAALTLLVFLLFAAAWIACGAFMVAVSRRMLR